MTRKASCSCRAASIVVEGEPVVNGLCHCSDCRRRTGSAFGWSTYFRDDQVRSREGDLQRRTLPAPFDQERFFCAGCGTTLWWTSAFMPGHVGVAGGCFAKPRLGPPTLTVANDQRCAWLTLPEGLATSFGAPSA